MINPCIKRSLTTSDPVIGPGAGSKLFISPALQAPAPQFGKRAGAHDLHPNTGTAVAPRRSPTDHRETYPASVLDDRPFLRRHPCLQLPLATAEPVNDHGGSAELDAVLAGHASNRPEPLPALGDRPDSNHQARESRGVPLRWARCSGGRLHLLEPADVVAATTRGHAQALCSRVLPAAALTLTTGLASPLCQACITTIGGS